jgi:hypothetical protein
LPRKTFSFETRNSATLLHCFFIRSGAIDMTPKQRALYALERMKGDDAERARMNFRGYSADQMELPHCQSGKSRREILEGYEQHEKEVQQAIDWVNRANHS